jgi:acyl-CoA thioester hydrolase
MPAFEHQVPLRWRDIDALGHVNHAVFLTLLEIGRDAFYRSLIGNPDYAIVRVELDFRAEILLSHAEVTVRYEVERLGTTSVITREQIVLPDGAVAAQARVVWVMWDPAAPASRPLTDSERDSFAAWAVED